MSVTYRELDWIVKDLRMFRWMPQEKDANTVLVEVIGSLGYKVLDGDGNPTLDAFGAEVWRSISEKQFLMNAGDVVAYFTQKAIEGPGWAYEAVLPETPSLSTLYGVDAAIMSLIYPVCQWMFATDRWSF